MVKATGAAKPDASPYTMRVRLLEEPGSWYIDDVLFA